MLTVRQAGTTAAHRGKPAIRCDRAGEPGWIVSALLPGTILCLLNAAKPIVVDDTAYHAFAVQAAHNPADPYGFTINWYGRTEPAFSVLAPPVAVYWWAAGIQLWGDNIVAAKLWLWPWCLALALSVRSLARRWLGTAATPIVWMIVLGPGVLPSLNLMLDVPALGLMLASLAVFFGSSNRLPWLGSAASGILAGLAMQTKYSAFVAVPALAAAAWFSENRRRDLARFAVAAALALGLTIGWEVWIAGRYGASHLLHHWQRDALGRMPRHQLFWPLFGLLGSAASPLLLLGAASARSSWLKRIGILAGIIAAYVVVAVVPRTEGTNWTPTAVAFGVVGAAVIVAIAHAAAARWLRPASPDDRFLAVWVGLELAGYFALSPWPAVRRVLGLSAAATMLAARNAVANGAGAGSMWFAASASVGLGIAMQVVDIENARLEREAVAMAQDRIAADGTPGTVWFAGQRGWQFYAERAGWEPISHGDSQAQPGDWLVLPRSDFGGPRPVITDAAELRGTIVLRSRLPLATIPWYYGTNAAVRRAAGDFITIDLYRVTRPMPLIADSR